MDDGGGRSGVYSDVRRKPGEEHAHEFAGSWVPDPGKLRQTDSIFNPKPNEIVISILCLALGELNPFHGADPDDVAALYTDDGVELSPHSPGGYPGISEAAFSLVVFVYVSTTFCFVFFMFCWTKTGAESESMLRLL